MEIRRSPRRLRQVPMELFLVIYTASGLVGAASHPMPDAEFCEEIRWVGQTLNDTFVKAKRPGIEAYMFKCEYHLARPEITAQIDKNTKEIYESKCVGLREGCGK